MSRNETMLFQRGICRNISHATIVKTTIVMPLLHDFELRKREPSRAEAVCRHLKEIFKKCERPARDDHQPERFVLELQMAIPRERHEDVRDEEQQSGDHDSLAVAAGAGLSSNLVFAFKRNLNRAARTMPSLNPRPESREGRPPMRSCAAGRKRGNVNPRCGSRKATEDSPDDYRKSGCSVSFYRQNWLAAVVWRQRKFCSSLSPLIRQEPDCRS
jgi:hypothetical protein